MPSPLQSSQSKPQETAPPSESSNWLVGNIVDPLVNASIIQPYDAIAGLTDALTEKNILPKCDLIDVPQANTGGLSWFAQTISGGVGSLVPYIVAGKLTGGVMKGAGRFIEATPELGALEAGGLTTKILASDKVAMVAGAGLYGGAMEPGQGQTRLGNAVGSMMGFAAFELGNKYTAGMSLGASLPLRALTGVGGGLAQYESNSLISNHNLGSLDGAEQSMLAGAAINVFLPVAEKGAHAASDNLSLAMGRPISAESFLAGMGEGGNPEVTKLLSDSPLTRIRSVDGETKIDQRSNVIDLNKGDGAAKVAHELSHRATARSAETESQFKDAAAKLSSDPDQAWQQYRSIRVGEEQSARDTENRALVAQGKGPAQVTDPDKIGSLTASGGRTYDQVWQDEFERFNATNGKYRPATDYAGSNPSYADIQGWTGAYVDTPDAPRERSYLDLKNTNNALHRWVYNDPEVPGKFQFVKYERTDNMAFQRYTKTDGGALEIYKLPVQTYWGSVKALETFGDGSTRYHILDGDHGVADKTVFETYPKGTWTDFGTVTSIVRNPDTSAYYGKLGGAEAVRYATPKDYWFGKVGAEATNADKSTVYYLTEGNSNWGLSAGDRVEWYPKGLKTYFNTTGKAQPNDVRTVLRGQDGITYIRPDESQLLLKSVGGKLQLTDTKPDPPVTGTLKQFFETYPKGLDTQYGKVSDVEYRADSVVYHKVPEAGQKSGGTTQIFAEPTQLDPRFGDVARVDTTGDGQTFYIKSDGGIIQPYPSGVDSNYGTINAVEQFPTEGWTKYFKTDGATVDEFPNGLSTNVGIADSIEYRPDSIIMRRTPPAPENGPSASPSDPWASMEFNFTKGSLIYRDPAGDVVPNGYKPATNFKFFEEYSPDRFPNGKTTPFGKAVDSTTDSSRNVTYDLTDGRSVTVTKDGQVIWN